MKGATVPHRGMLADNVLKLRGRDALSMVGNPSMVGKDANGYIVGWHYGDCDVLLAYWNGAYRVREVVKVVEGVV